MRNLTCNVSGALLTAGRQGAKHGIPAVAEPLRSAFAARLPDVLETRA